MTKVKKYLHTELGHSTPDRITVRGRDLPTEILGHLNLGDMAFLELTCRTRRSAVSGSSTWYSTPK